ncbi:hypothetical protein GLP21_12065 [Photobacterium carnosum]|uniref:Uncharacterized protein n=1 Tax=Photobacterium carnosum TaxID=2023717 RepID=A0A2N4UVZ1_9GAMM|nr:MULTISPECIES: hypothetical protein [Photobacterium]MCD9485851.1 hypothetical protein [Photobacterium iliopiscarium]MCD9539516.1 hypothetical protein [Photobacterium carnosum]MCD9543206.1 hypothetical protein [Photobacterium carnosum]MCD9546999.1 hypothetical protein [Photobacterium carnosum]MCD9549363.1 hypothetical protein [Photobacterium carnosum]
MFIENKEEYLDELGLIIRAHVSQFVMNEYASLKQLFDVADFGIKVNMYDDTSFYVLKYVEIYPSTPVLLDEDYVRFLCAMVLSMSDSTQELVDEMVRVGIKASCFMNEQFTFCTDGEWVNKQRYGKCNITQLERAFSLMRYLMCSIARNINNYVKDFVISVCNLNAMNQQILAKRLIKTANVTVRLEVEGRYFDLTDVDYTDINSLTSARVKNILEMNIAPCRYSCQIFHNNELIGEAARNGFESISDEVRCSTVIFRRLLITAIKKARLVLPRQQVQVTDEKSELNGNDLFWGSLTF